MGEIIVFPGVRSEPVRQWNSASRPTHRRATWKQRRLPLEPAAPSIEQRINAAKATSANYREKADEAGREAEECRAMPGKETQRQQARHRQEVYAGLAETWDKRTLELIAERDRANAQQELPECGCPHSSTEGTTR